MALSIYIGIDVACGLRKRLSLCAIGKESRATPLLIPKHLSDRIRRGCGNLEIGANAPFREAARDIGEAIKLIERELDWRVERIAIDAPASPPSFKTRLAEEEMRRLGWAVFSTPSESEWSDIKERCGMHLQSGRGAATLPYANKIWMLFGFELFNALRSMFDAEIIEVYPYAIVRSLLSRCEHKSTLEGYRKQLSAVASATGWNSQELEARLKERVSGTRHDRLDAFMAAWVASLPLNLRRAFGDAGNPDDAIWVPSGVDA